jgi:uncharacterized lipoprotein YbaY
MTETLISGEIVLPNNAEHFSDAFVSVELEAIGMMDMPAQVVLEMTMSNISYTGKPIYFELDGHLPEHTGSYSIRVHINFDKHSGISIGDYVTKRTNPVLQDGKRERIRIAVEKV